MGIGIVAEWSAGEADTHEPSEYDAEDPESDAIVSGHSITSHRGAPSVTRQPTPVVMGEALSGRDPSNSIVVDDGPPAPVTLQLPPRRSSDASARGGSCIPSAAGGRDTVDMEIEMEISDSAASVGLVENSSSGVRELASVDAHTLRRKDSSKVVQFEAGGSACAPSPSPPCMKRSASMPARTTPGDDADAGAGAAAASAQPLPPHAAAEGSMRDEMQPPETYETEQHAQAEAAVDAVARGRIGFLDRLERVRRGNTFSRRPPGAHAHAHAPASDRESSRGGVGGKGEGAAAAAAAAPARGPYEEASAKYESYQFDEPESKLHLEERAERTPTHGLKLLLFTSLIVFSIGGSLGVTSAFIAVVEGQLFSYRYNRAMELLWPCCEPIDASSSSASSSDVASSSSSSDDSASSASSRRRLGAGGDWGGPMDCSACADSHGAGDSSHAGDVLQSCFAFVGLSLAMVLVAALLCYWAPRAALSGLPQVKAYLNGTRVQGLFHTSTLVAKAVGITLIVSTALPLGKEGPMVHIGSIIAYALSRIQFPGAHDLLELRTPQAQRLWVGMGAAAGVAAAFNAPVGGILYSFEEVCSHWPHKLTWRAFFCVIVAAFTFVNIMNSSLGGGRTATGSAVREALVLNQNIEYEWQLVDFVWCALLGVVGGVLGGGYTRIVCKLCMWRRRLTPLPRLRVVEALVLSMVFFVVAFALPFGFGCSPCDEAQGAQCASTAASGGRRLHDAATNFSGGGGGGGGGGDAAPIEHSFLTAGGLEGLFGGRNAYDGDGFSDVGGGGGGHGVGTRGRRLGGGGAILLIRWHCPEGQYSEMATLFQSGQEGVIKHLLQLSEPGVQYDIGIPALGWFLVTYFLLAALLFGIGVPSGNFVPAMTIGACFGRLIGEVLRDTSALNEDDDTGKFAMLGAAAMLGGVTRMTLALAVLLVEVTKDTGAMLFIMTTLAVAKMVGDLISPSFDDAMIHVARLPYLEEDPPHEFESLTVRDVMSTTVVVLKEVERVGDLLALVKRTKHNGFPVVDVGRHQRCTFFAGLVLRRQLMLVLHHRVWEAQERGEPLSAEVRRTILEATRVPASKLQPAQVALGLSDADRARRVDLRPFLDPCPFVVNELMPLRRVYKLFNVLGVRHLTVVDCREQVVGIVTRKDVCEEIIDERIERRHESSQHGHGGADDQHQPQHPPPSTPQPPPQQHVERQPSSALGSLAEGVSERTSAGGEETPTPPAAAAPPSPTAAPTAGTPGARAVPISRRQPSGASGSCVRCSSEMSSGKGDATSTSV